MAALGGAVLMISPEGIRSGIKKHMKLICSLCLLCVMIAPLGRLMETLGSLGNSGNLDIGNESELESMYESIYQGNLTDEFSGSIGEKVKTALYERFSIPGEECRVETNFADRDGDGLREPCSITVILSGLSVFKDPRAVEKYVSETFGCECICAIE